MTQKTFNQFRELKAKHPDALLLFRSNDHYHAYEEDAKALSKLLGISLFERVTTWTKERGLYTTIFRSYKLDDYLPKIIRAGYHVALVDQLEKPKEFVKRGITEKVAP